jgi:hypothetical protein
MHTFSRSAEFCGNFHAVGGVSGFGGEKGERKEEERSLVDPLASIQRKRCKESPPFLSNGDYTI